MKNYSIPTIALLFAVCFGVCAQAQQIARVSPPNITFRGISIANYNHSMVVGDSAAIFLCTTSPDSGGYWWPVAPPCDRSHTFYGVSYYDTLRAAIVGDDGLIFTTTDQGMSWAQSGAGMTGQTLRAIKHTSKGGLIVVGDSGIILQSLDSGKTWTTINSSTTYNIKALTINTRGSGFFVGDHGLIGKTTDYGAIWENVTDTIRNLGANNDPINFRSVAIDNATAGTAMAVGDSGGFAKTTNGETWNAFQWIIPGLSSTDSAIDAPIFAHTSYSSVMYYGNGIAFGDGKGNVTWQIYSDDDFDLYIGGSTTTNQSNQINISGFYGDADGGTDIAPDRAQCEAIWLGGYPNNVMHYAGPNEIIWTGTDQVGYIWHAYIEPALTNSSSDFLFASIDSLGTGFATAIDGYFLKTTDNGFTWAENPNYPNDRLTDIHTIDSENAFAIGWSASLFRTTDGGGTWDSTSIGAANQERLHSIANPANNVYVVCGDFGTIVRSTDNALTWNASTVPTTNYLEAVAFSSPEIGIAVGQNGTIVRTTDQGVTWANINNQLTGTDYSFRELQAFPNGTYYATTDSGGLYKSTDEGLDWLALPNAPATMGMSFYNDSIGVIAEYGTYSTIGELVSDTAYFAFTKDGFATAPKQFAVPIINSDRMIFHFLDSSSFLCFASNAFVVKVDMSENGASITQISSPQTSPIQLFPNPSSTHSTTIDYDLDGSGSTTLELWNELGQKVQTLFMGSEEAGHHSHEFKIDPDLHGSFFVKVISGTEMKTLPIIFE